MQIMLHIVTSNVSFETDKNFLSTAKSYFLCTLQLQVIILDIIDNNFNTYSMFMSILKPF